MDRFVRFPHECRVSTSFYHMHTTCPANFIILDFITYLVRSVRPEAPHYKSLPTLHLICLLRSISFSTLFWNTLSLYLCSNVTDWELHPHKTPYNIVALNIVDFFMFLGIKWQRQKTPVRMVNVIPVLNVRYAEAMLLRMPSEWTHYEHIPVVNLLFKHE